MDEFSYYLEPKEKVKDPFNVLNDYRYGHCVQCGNAIKRKDVSGGKGEGFIYYCDKCTNFK